MSGITVLSCRPQPGTAPGAVPATTRLRGSRPTAWTPAAWDRMERACDGLPLHRVGRRPGKQIDGLLDGRVVVIGDDADMAAVVVRLLRRDLLGDVMIGYAPLGETPMTDIWSLATGPQAVDAARHAEVDVVPLVRDDVGGVLVGAAQFAPLIGTVYVDSERILNGSAPIVQVEPEASKGVAVSVRRRRFLGFGRRPAAGFGRAVELGFTDATVVIHDGVRHPRSVNRWVYYRHTKPLRLIRGLY